MHRRSSVALLAAALLVSLAACGTADRGSVAPYSAASGTITVTDAWVRAAPTTDVSTAGYLTITNAGSSEDALVGASSPAAGTVEIHQTSMSSGMAGMQPVDRIAVAGGSTVTLAPGGHHLMIMGLSKPLAAGTTVELDLTFEHAGRMVVQAEVRQG